MRVGGEAKHINIHPVMSGTLGTPGVATYYLSGSGGGGTLYQYGYDYRTRRVQRVESGTATNVTFSGGTSVLEMTGEDTASSPTVEFVRGADMGGGVGGLLYSVRSGTYSVSHFNSRGDVTAKLTASGTGAYAMTYQASYEAFGKQTQTVGSTPDRQKANTKEEDPTGLLNEGHRYRDLETGTFLTRDPAGFVDGPNLYAYVVQNPWTNFDPEGLDAQNTKEISDMLNSDPQTQAMGETVQSQSQVTDAVDTVSNGIIEGGDFVASLNPVQNGITAVSGKDSLNRPISMFGQSLAIGGVVAGPTLKLLSRGISKAKVILGLGKIEESARTTATVAEEVSKGAAKWTPHSGFQMPAAAKGRFLGDVGDSAFALSDDAAAAMSVPRGTTIPWKEGIPDFGKVAVPGPGGIPSTFNVSGLTGVHASDRTLMLQQMASQAGMSQRAIQQWLASNGVRLHHAGGEAVQIVPAPIHGLHHSGGAQQLRGGN